MPISFFPLLCRAESHVFNAVSPFIVFQCRVPEHFTFSLFVFAQSRTLFISLKLFVAISMATRLVCVCCRAQCELSMAGCTCPSSKMCQPIEVAYWLTGLNTFKGKVYCEKCIKDYDRMEKSINKTHHFQKYRHRNCTDVLENIIVKTDGPDGRNVSLELSPAIAIANNSLNRPPQCTPVSTSALIPPGLESVKLQQALSFIDVLQSRIEALEQDDCHCRFGALQERVEALENHECRCARSRGHETLDSLAGTTFSKKHKGEISPDDEMHMVHDAKLCDFQP